MARRRDFEVDRVMWTIIAFISIFFAFYFLGMCVGSDDNPFAMMGLILTWVIMITGWFGHIITYQSTNQNYEWYIIVFGILFYSVYSTIGFVVGYLVGKYVLGMTS